jgi:putative SOS response-associated peptidase YedK
MVSKSKNPSWKRDYQKEDKYEDSPTQVKHRELRNKARSELTKARHKSISHNLDVAHIEPLAGRGTDAARNLRVETIKKNRSWRRGQKGYHVPKDV